MCSSDLGTESLDESQLATLVTRDCMIGVTLPKSPTEPR